MSVKLIKKIGRGAYIGLWQIDEDLEKLVSGIDLDEEEKKTFAAFKSDQRKKQWLAYRHLLKEMTSERGLKIHYSKEGKPYIPGSVSGISVSHTDEYAAVIIAENAEAGIDIELPKPRILKIRNRYLHPEEDKFISDGDIEELTLYWCAKEALYKLNGRKNIDFKSQLKIEKKRDRKMKGWLCESEKEEAFDIFSERIDDLICVYVIKEKRL